MVEICTNTAQEQLSEIGTSWSCIWTLDHVRPIEAVIVLKNRTDGGPGLTFDFIPFRRAKEDTGRWI